MKGDFGMETPVNENMKYEAEAAERWGATAAYRQYEETAAGYTEQKKNELAAETDELMAAFASCMKNGGKPGSEQARALVKRLQNHITDNYYDCSDGILSYLGQMYAADERFRKNIDRHGDGTASFICEAIGLFCRK